MRKIILILMFIMAFMSVKSVLASGFFLKSIGNVETGGQQISHWWYTSANPVLRGEATPGSNVTFDIDGTSQMIVAESDGAWNYQPTILSAGDHQVTITSDGSTIKFTLTIGNENINWDAVGSGSAQTLPTAGTSMPTLILTLIGLGSLAMGGKMVFSVNKD